jgi:hypothetical protein
VPRFADGAVVDVHEWLLRPEAAPRVDGSAVPAYRMAVAELAAGRSSRPGTQPGDQVEHRRAPRLDALTTGTTCRATDPRDAAMCMAAAGGEPSDGAPALRTVFAPLVARGRVLGVVALTRSPASRPFDDLDVELAEQLAARTATAVDNARLYAGERATALTLQRSLLPHGTPRLAGVQVASRYLPSSLATEVGGDWYDVIPLSCGGSPSSWATSWAAACAPPPRWDSSGPPYAPWPCSTSPPTT